MAYKKWIPMNPQKDSTKANLSETKALLESGASGISLDHFTGPDFRVLRWLYENGRTPDKPDLERFIRRVNAFHAPRQPKQKAKKKKR